MWQLGGAAWRGPCPPAPDACCAMACPRRPCPPAHLLAHRQPPLHLLCPPSVRWLRQAVDSAVKSGADLVLCDTSGRLHTNWSLMDELAKCKRSISKRLPDAPHEVRTCSTSRQVAIRRMHAAAVPPLPLPCRLHQASLLPPNPSSAPGAACARRHHRAQHAEPGGVGCMQPAHCLRHRLRQPVRCRESAPRAPAHLLHALVVLARRCLLALLPAHSGSVCSLARWPTPTHRASRQRSSTRRCSSAASS